MKNREVINSYIDKWIEDYNNRQRPVWNYEDGCVMLGAQYLYEATGDEKYINCIRTFMDRYIQAVSYTHLDVYKRQTSYCI